MITRETIESRASERNRADIREALLLLALGVPFCIFSLFLIHMFVFLAVMSLSPVTMSARSYAPIFWLVTLAALVAFIVGAWRHPAQEWVKADAGMASRKTLPLAWSEPAKLLGYRLLMLNKPVPAFLRVALNALGNLLLGGARNVREAIDHLMLARRRSSRLTQVAAMAVIQWLEPRGKATGSEMVDYLSRREKRFDGFLLARELGLIAEEKTSEGLVYRVS